MVVLIKINLQTKFEVSSFIRSHLIRSQDVTLVPKCRNMARGPDHADFRDDYGIIVKLGFPVVILHNKFEVHICTLYEQVKGGTKCRKLGGLG